jgi:hypothetical protein
MSELDVKIARIMGGAVHTDRETWHEEGGFLLEDGRVWIRVSHPRDEDVWSPSTHIAEAMEVVDRMRGDLFSFNAWQPSRIAEIPERTPVEIAVVSFICSKGPCTRHGTTHHNHHGAYDVEGETLPMAICKAALIALKVE